MKELLNSIGLHPEKWQNWVHCGLDEWLVTLMQAGGASTLAFYLIFSVLLIIGYNWGVGRRIFTKMWWIWLSIVFVLCGTMHFGQTYAKTYPILYALALFYPILVPCMGMVLYETVISIFFKWRQLKTAFEVQVEKDEIYASVDTLLSQLEKSDFSKEFKEKAIQRLREKHNDI